VSTILDLLDSAAYILVCIAFGIYIGKYHQNIFNNILLIPNKILLIIYVFEISNLDYIGTSTSEIFVLFEKYRIELGNEQFLLLCENIINYFCFETFQTLSEILDKNTFNVMFSIILNQIKNDDQKILIDNRHFNILLKNKYLSDYPLSIDEFKVSYENKY